MARSHAGHQPPKVGVVREAFAPHDAAPRLLATAVAPLGAGRAAVASAISQPAARLLVDEYERTPDGAYRLTNSSSDLLRYAAHWRPCSRMRLDFCKRPNDPSGNVADANSACAAHASSEHT